MGGTLTYDKIQRGKSENERMSCKQECV